MPRQPAPQEAEVRAALGGTPVAGPRESRPLTQPSPAKEEGSRATQPTAPKGDGSRVAVARPVPIAARQGTLPVARTPRDEEDEPAEELSRFALRNAPPWLVSTVVHMVLLIVLAVWLLPSREKVNVALNLVYSDRLGEQLDDDSVTVGADNPTLNAKEQIVTPDDLKPVDDPFAAPPNLDINLDGNTASSELAAPTIGIALLGREQGSREALLAAYGGNSLSEDAVTLGLEWLARQQQKDGSWSLVGPYKDGASNEIREAATAMALLAFQGRGNTHKSGPFRKNVDLGFKALIKSQDAEGNFYKGSGSAWLYTQGQATIAVCELYGMTKDEALRPVAEKAVKFCVDAQDALGGWRYRPRDDSDTSVTGWVVMALQSARMAGLEVPETTLEKVGMYLDKVAREDGAKYAYQVGMEPKLAMTAEALLCRQYLGWPRTDQRLLAGADYLGHNLPLLADRDVYYWYYATQVMHHMEGDYWKNWNAALRDLLVNSQEKAPPERGSWDPKGKNPDAWGVRNQGGRLYVTCLSLYMLEVYYRHMPIYGRLK